MQIWLRMPKHMLTRGGRTVFGSAISHDELRDAFNRMGILCYDEYPTGDVTDALQQVPDNPEECLVMWYGDPAGWVFGDYPHSGVVGYMRCGETTLPPEMVYALNKCDVVFVASNAARASFAGALSVPVYVLSGGVVPEQFPHIERNYETGTFTFLHVGSTHWRKGSDIACKAFSMAFTPDDDVRLLIISPGKTPMFERLELEYGYNPNIEFVCKIVSDRKTVAEEYYTPGHVLVYPSIMEGWGRCLAEAMFTGMPALCFRASSMLDQFHEDCGWWIEPDIDKFDGYWIPSALDLAYKMRYTYGHRELCREKAFAARQWATDYLTWDRGIANALPTLNIVYGTENADARGRLLAHESNVNYATCN